MKRLCLPVFNCAKYRTLVLSRGESSAKFVKYLSVSCANNNFVRNDRKSSYEESSKDYRNKSGVSGLGCFGGFAIVGLAIKYLCDENESFSILPQISAAKPMDPTDVGVGGGGLRSRFNFIADVVEKCASPVVYIEIQDMRRVDMFTKMPVTASNGSGFIVKEDGLILTNAHVVINKPHSTVSVRLTNGQTYPGTVEEVDMQSDLATVRIKCKGLPVMRLGNSSDIRPGEFVIAMGAPLSLSNTVTAGVISTVNRHGNELGIKNKDMDYIQTDAAITFGNSGGPLVNLDGEAIGINSMKVAAGISFAIPIDYAKQFLERAEHNAKQRASSSATKSPVRRYMGITMLSLTDDIIRQLQTRNHEIPTEVTHGVLVWKVVVGSPAHNGGLHPADIITHVNGAPVRSAADIYEALERNTSLSLVVIRGLRRVDVRVVPEVY